MRQMLAVLTSNALSRYGTIFSIGALESLLNESWDTGVPSFMSHDCHRPFGWSVGLSLYLEPSLAHATGLFLMPETAEDEKKIKLWVKHNLFQRISEQVAPHRPELERKLRAYLSGKEVPMMQNCAALLDEGLAKRVFPDIFAQRDKDGLVSLTLLNSVAPGVFESDGLLLFAHPFFRRSLSRLNSLSETFFGVLQLLSKRTDLTIRLALDEDMVGLAGTYQQGHEFQYWWGPKFSDDLSTIKTGVVTRHEADEDQRFFHGVSRTEFWWYDQDARRTFECEEVRDIATIGAGVDQYGCRYVHSILNPSSGNPIHADGAIRMYDESAMLQRMESDILHAGRHAGYTKLWRVDGELDVSIWKGLVTQFYRDNKLIGEYFGGEDVQWAEPPSEPPSIQAASILSQYTPTNMEPGQGIKISISYHQRTVGSDAKRIIRTFDSFTHDSSEYNYIEAEAVDVIKMLRRMDDPVEVQDDSVCVAFKDGVINLPLIMHLGNNAAELAERTQKAIACLCKIWAQYKLDRILSFNLGIQYSEKDVYFSFAGHIADMNIWFQQSESKLPPDGSIINIWAEQAYEVLTKQFPPSDDSPPLAEILKQSGMLIFTRKFLKPEEYSVRIDENGGRAIADLIIPRQNQELYEALSSDILRVAPAIWVRESLCSSCGEEYRLCDCIRYVDEGVYQVITDIIPLGLVWSSRKAFYEHTQNLKPLEQ